MVTPPPFSNSSHFALTPQKNHNKFSAPNFSSPKTPLQSPHSPLPSTGRPNSRLDPIVKHAEVEVAAVEMRSEPDKAAAARAQLPPPGVKKDRHIVSWTPEEDELLREQVSAHGTDNWTSIAARFKDKTSRQCRRRWYTYLNSEGKKGGWSAEEDMLLCEAQKIFGNRWTEIAKVVSGRTDNAVKNRFSTLCKKRAKNALTKENNGSWVNPNKKRVIIHSESFVAGGPESSVHMKQIRYGILDHKEHHNPNESLSMQPVTGEVQLRSPLSVLSQNINNVGGLPCLYYCNDNSKPEVHHGSNNKTEGRFLRGNEPKLTALLQQAELLSSLALKVNTENTSQSLENAWKELQDYLIQKGGGISSRTSDMDFLLDDFKDLIDELKSSSTRKHLSPSPSSRQPGLQEESQDGSEHSTGSIQVFQVHANDNNQTDDTMSNQNALISCHQEDELGPGTCTSKGALSSSEEKEIDGNIYLVPSSEFDSPYQTIPTFKSLTEGIPSPNFSASERQFLLSVLGISSPAPIPSSAQQPSCKRVLLDSL